MALVLKLLLLAVGALLAWQLVTQWRQTRGRAARRAAFLDGCKWLFSGGTKAIAATGFPRLAGSYRGHEFDLQVVPDTLNFRKLPALWVLVTLTEPQKVSGSFDLMMRPRGVETFSNFARLPVQIDIPPGFPADCAIRCDDAQAVPPPELVRRHLELVAGTRGKELVIAAKGLRAVFLAEEAQRGSYLLFRDSEMGLSPLDPALLRPVLDGLLALADDLALSRQEDR